MTPASLAFVAKLAAQQLGELVPAHQLARRQLGEQHQETLRLARQIDLCATAQVELSKIKGDQSD